LKFTYTLGLLCLFFASAFGQTARVKGVLLDENQFPIEGATVKVGAKGVTTNENGFYQLLIPARQRVTIVFSHVSFKNSNVVIELQPNEDFELNAVLRFNVEEFGAVVVSAGDRKRVEGITSIEPTMLRKIPGANAGVENILRTLAGVNSNNELSTQYAVRGGNFDENLVYVNEIEVYRPFLIRSGQQEGLSFTNSDMVQNVDFSAGGFQAKYGDKMSSVLDITYRRPTKFGAAAEASFLGGALTLEGISKNQKWAGIIGARYRDNSLLVNSQETQTNFTPAFADVQAYLTYHHNAKWQWSFLGNISSNRYQYQPLTRQTNFGTIDEPRALLVFYQGQEDDRYKTYFGAIKANFNASENTKYKFIASAYHTLEQEYFDIQAAYFICEVDGNLGSENFGEVIFNRGIGSQLVHGRNDLDALIFNKEMKGFHTVKSHQLEWGVKYTHESVRDRVVEWEIIDSAGFHINNPILDLPNNDQPYNPYVGPLVPFQNVRATNFVEVNRFSGYAQWSHRTLWRRHEMYFNAGVRAHQWQVTGASEPGKVQRVVSPRFQMAIKPDWKKDFVYRIAGGSYDQPPFYREMRDSTGVVRPNVKAQRSIHFTLAQEHVFKMWDRSFKWVSEVYYKSMSDVNPYTLENVRIRYRATNNATAYAQGLDMRVNGEFVPGIESWVSFGYMKTEENIDNKGYIARPTDQRLKFAILFQDYMPNIPGLKVYLNLVYQTGVPGGSPSYADPYDFQLRLRDYRRADAGFFYVLTEANAQRKETHWLKNFDDLSIGFEIYNMFDNQNAITNTWVRDVSTRSQFAIPNFMTTRVFNLKLQVRI